MRALNCYTNARSVAPKLFQIVKTPLYFRSFPIRKGYFKQPCQSLIGSCSHLTKGCPQLLRMMPTSPWCRRDPALTFTSVRTKQSSRRGDAGGCHSPSLRKGTRTFRYDASDYQHVVIVIIVSGKLFWIKCSHHDTSVGTANKKENFIKAITYDSAHCKKETGFCSRSRL